MIEWRPEHLGDGSQHALKVRKNFIVPEPQHTPPFPLEFAVAQVVVAGVACWPPSTSMIKRASMHAKSTM